MQFTRNMMHPVVNAKEEEDLNELGTVVLQYKSVVVSAVLFFSLLVMNSEA